MWAVAGKGYGPLFSPSPPVVTNPTERERGERERGREREREREGGRGMDRERKRYPEANVWPENQRLVSQRTAVVW